jgi:transcriptional regulator with XRE-family HTH domain
MRGEDGAEMNLGRNIAVMRASRGFRALSVAKKTGITPGYLSRIEHGTILPSIPTLIRLAKALNCEVWELWI